MNNVLFSSDSVEWETPQDLFDYWNNLFHFTLDPCASLLNHKCDRYFTIADDGLKQSWKNEVVFCNPPYGRKFTGEWVEKAYNEFKNNGTIVVMLIPARTDTKWFHKYVYPFAEIHFLPGRLRFNNSKNNAPFPSMIVIFNK